jgi:uracil-DNA glycosylase
MNSSDADKRVRLLRLAEQVKACRRCPGLNIRGVTESAPGYGSGTSPVMIVGQSLCGPCMATQIPFTGGCGALLDTAFERAGVAKASLFITNVVHCHPPDNRPSQEHEIANCAHHLEAEVSIVRPVAAIGLGKDASAALAALSDRHPATRFHYLQHPSYVRRRPLADRDAFVEELARLIRDAFSSESSRLLPPRRRRATR